MQNQIAKPEKKKYCKKCGSEIDQKTKKCTGCGKQYFHLPKITVLNIVLIVLLVCLFGLNVYQYWRSTELTKDLEKANANYSEIISQYGELYESNKAAELENSFWESHAVICTSEGKKYHCYGCSHLDDRECTVYSYEMAKRLGYEPCLDCINTNINWDKIEENAQIQDAEQYAFLAEDFAKANGTSK